MGRITETRVSIHGPVCRELWRVRFYSLARLYHWNPRTRRYGCLSLDARNVIRGAVMVVTGMYVGPNEYWLPQVMSEAIEAADQLGL